ncbi:hypothetical protein [Spiroplasma sp. ChiS]
MKGLSPVEYRNLNL